MTMQFLKNVNDVHDIIKKLTDLSHELYSLEQIVDFSRNDRENLNKIYLEIYYRNTQFENLLTKISFSELAQDTLEVLLLDLTYILHKKIKQKWCELENVVKEGTDNLIKLTQTEVEFFEGLINENTGATRNASSTTTSDF